MRPSWHRHHAALLGFLGLVSFPTLPEAPTPPAEVPVSLYVWNAADQPAELAVAVEGVWLFHDVVPAGQGVSRPEAVTLKEGAHAGEAVAGTVRRPVTFTVTADGNRWLVVTWWGRDELETGLQRQPPWVGPSS